MSRRAERWRCECRWAWLNLRARGWRAGLAIALLAVALGANAIVFSAADSIVFHRTPFADAGRLMEMHQRDQPNAIVSERFATRYWLNEARPVTATGAAPLHLAARAPRGPDRSTGAAQELKAAYVRHSPKDQTREGEKGRQFLSLKEKDSPFRYFSCGVFRAAVGRMITRVPAAVAH